MLNLLKADLYRITRPRGLRGAFWQYLTVCAGLFFLVYVVLWMIAGGFDFSTGVVTSVTTFASPSTMLGSMLGDLFPLIASFFMVEHVLSDFKEGFARNIVSSRTGKLSYFAERIVFAGIVTIAFFVAISLMLFILCMATGGRFEMMDTPLAFASWAVATCLNTWALSVLSLIIAYGTRVTHVSYIAAFCLCSSLAPESLMLASGLIQAFAPGFIGIADALSELVCWMPSNLVSWLSAGGSQGMAEGWGSLGAALPGGGFTQALVAPLPWLAAASALVLAICRKRDV